jgi:hypothetical protein
LDGGRIVSFPDDQPDAHEKQVQKQPSLKAGLAPEKEGSGCGKNERRDRAPTDAASENRAVQEHDLQKRKTSEEQTEILSGLDYI